MGSNNANLPNPLMQALMSSSAQQGMGGNMGANMGTGMGMGAPSGPASNASAGLGQPTQQMQMGQQGNAIQPSLMQILQGMYGGGQVGAGNNPRAPQMIQSPQPQPMSSGGGGPQQMNFGTGRGGSWY